MSGERDPRAIRLTAEWLGVSEDEVRARPQTAHEAYVTLGLALRDFKTALRQSSRGRFVVWLVDRLAVVLPKPKNRI